MTNSYTASQLENARAFLKTAECGDLVHSNYFADSNDAAYDEDISLYLDGHAARDEAMKEEAVSRRVIRVIVSVFASEDGKADAATDLAWIAEKCDCCLEYMSGRYSGQKDSPVYQKFKMIFKFR